MSEEEETSEVQINPEEETSEVQINPEEETSEVRSVKAVEAIVDAASLEVDTLTEQKLSSNFDNLKSSFDNKLETVSESLKQEMKASNDELESKIDTMNTHIITLEESMEEIKGFLATQEKRQKIEFAISCSNLQEFKYKSEDTPKMSSSLVEKVLRWFALGYGYKLPSDAIANSSSVTDKTKEELFRAKLMKQLENLIGHKPRLVDNGKGEFTVFYE